MGTMPARGIRRILVPLDGSFFAEQALPYAQASGGPDSELILLEVFPEAEPVRGLLGNVLITAEEIREAYDEGADKGLREAQRAWLGDRPHVRIETAVGDAAEEILRIAERERVDLIVMASHGRGAVGRWVSGSVADRVVRTALTPVMVVRAGEGIPTEGGAQEIRRLIVPLDGSDLAAQALPFVEALAGSHNVPVVLVKVTDLAQELAGAMVYGAAINREVYDEVLANARAKARDELVLAGERLRSAGITASEEVLDGHVAEAIAGFARTGDVIVMTSHGRGGLKRWLMGSVAEKLVREGPVPVVLVPATIRQRVLEPKTEAAPARAFAGTAAATD
jgi:nucleotide-binding universal stress UspA family protein